MNTWGIHSVNSFSYNIHLKNHTTEEGEAERAKLVTYQRIQNLVLNILGYLPIISIFSGFSRMVLGTAYCLMGSDYAEQFQLHQIVPKEWNEDLFATGVCQIARGALEMIPFAKVANIAFDVLFTLLNVGAEFGPKESLRYSEIPVTARNALLFLG